MKQRRFRIGVTICAVVAVLAAAMLPAAHMHQTLSGKPLIHSHLIDDPVQHDGTLDHGDHHAVRTFAPVFTVEPTADSAPALAVDPIFALAAPETRSLGYSDPLDAPVIHGPPLRVVSLRAPPA